MAKNPNIRAYDFQEFTETNHKAIGVNEVVDHALDRNLDTISLISSGNYRAEILKEVKRRGLESDLRVVNLVNRPARNALELEIEGNRILKDSAERENYVTERIGGNVGDYTDFMSRDLQDWPQEVLDGRLDYIAVPVGSGRLFASIYWLLEGTGLDTKLVGVLPEGENGIFNDHNLYEDEHGFLHFKEFRPKSPADKLICPFTAFKPGILHAQKEGHKLVEVTSRQLRKANRKAKQLGLDAEISGSAGFVLYDPKVRKQLGISEEANIQVVSTGRGEFKQRQLIQSLQPFLKPAVLAATATLLLLPTVKNGITKYQQHQDSKQALIMVAELLAEKLVEERDFTCMPLEELGDYITEAEGRVGGPIHYWGNDVNQYRGL